MTAAVEVSVGVRKHSQASQLQICNRDLSAINYADMQLSVDITDRMGNVGLEL